MLPVPTDEEQLSKEAHKPDWEMIQK